MAASKTKAKTKTAKAKAKTKAPISRAKVKAKAKAKAKAKPNASAKAKAKAKAKPTSKTLPARPSWGDPAKGTPRYRRAKILGELETYVRKTFAKHKQLRSALFGVAQYWADEADDAVHSIVVFSENETPFWPHRCGWETEHSAGEPAVSAPDRCSSCGKYGWLPFDSNGGAIVAFQSCCLEGASQESTAGEAYLPYAVLRRADGSSVELDIIGGPVRAWLEDVTTTNDPDSLDYGEEPDDGDEVEAPGPRASRPLDPATRSLLDLVHAKPHDDAPRAVLADHLQQENDPLGEYITLALTNLDRQRRASADTRMRELEAAHVATWLGPLLDVAPPEQIELSRGFVRRLSVHMADEDVAKRVIATPEWGTVEELWFLPQSVQRVSAAMKSLRSVGPLDRSGLESLAKLGAKLSLERLDVVVSTDAVLETLAGLELPKLRYLGINSTRSTMREREVRNPFTGQMQRITERQTNAPAITPTMLEPVMRASFWRRLEEVALATIAPSSISSWLKRPTEKRPNTLSFIAASPSGALAGFRLRAKGNAVVIDVPALGSQTTFAQLAEMVEAVPASFKVSFASTRWFAPSAVDLKTLSTATKRPIARA
jgi:uncharacterized protein (TIGR02996 family)